jgi:DNA-binding MarR family transcriptional regulator/GNAT superfamily N-acetyltransferase
VAAAQVAAVREFNRFYTNTIGLLREGLHGTPYSLTEARLIFELARRDQTEAAALRAWLDIDAGYLSRLLARFETDGLLTRSKSPRDGRKQVIALTQAGRAVFAKLDGLAAAQARTLLSGYRPDERDSLTGAMASIQQTIGRTPPAGGFLLRPPAPGDLGWVVQRNGALYHDEYGWDASYEALVARVVADYAGRAGQDREAAWIADVSGRPAGCVFCMRKTGTTAQLRLLLVEPWARGMGIGGRLVAECVAFARQAGYSEIVLWTNSVLHAARRIYQRAGFTLTGSSPHHSFGHDLVGEDWALPLA